MNDTNKWIIGVALTMCTNIAAVAYMQGGTKTLVESTVRQLDQVSNSVKSLQNDVGSLKNQVFTVQQDTNGNGLIIRRVEGTVKEISDKVSDHGERIGVIEFKTGIKG
ncbi:MULTISPECIES: hypothetical protein [Vibrio harveyi group]|uniref:hypothetical protein n=1 Tax=Vibrio harveyi group TaxID=717610 RepID=UPI002380A270|nr:hypothetical protein [Vibrio harveyi]WJT09286.1 hypothetical protein PH545_24990 [Vibrio harveyi]